MPTVTPPQWPGIGRAVSQSELPKYLFRVASLHARRALASASDDLSILDRAVSIGTSVELLAKAAVASISPVLLAEDRQPKHLLQFVGVGELVPAKVKTRSATECLTLLKQCDPFDYNSERDSVVFDIRNLATHIGCVDLTTFEPALTTMVALSEHVIATINESDPSLNRTSYWGEDFLTQVDERLKAQAEAKRLMLEQLKAAARRELDRLQGRGLDHDALSEWAERAPAGYYGDDGAWTRQKCPVCKYEGWLEYSVHRSTIEVEYDDNGRPGIPFVEVFREPQEFECSVCGLRLSVDLLPLEQIGETQWDEDEATPDEISAAEDAAIGRYDDSE
ncbi:hypothetical protein [Mycolicibacterium lutetiense]|uniref:Uncharacterized protein n=1 Tax=Mycolicibacterium lutetiense TaxID=1641992 RepID=A0ABS4ZYR5_9MYCO|nr:hypothetical protein [Mycolicibacterium lutetiense]MBP2454623.1 hypothetical protein [Mycolicibacterium lutetiense]